MFLVKTQIRDSAIHGLGVFAAEFIPAGTTVWIFRPDFDFRVSEESVAKLPELARKSLLHYSAKWGGGYVISADDARFLNHSEAPNLKTMDYPDSDVAIRDIQPGEELLEDYREFDDTFAGRSIETPADTREPSKCGHKWDESIHRGCPRCAVSIGDAWLKTFADRWRVVLKESSPSGDDFGNSTVAGIAKAALDDLAKGISKEFLDSLAVDTREPATGEKYKELIGQAAHRVDSWPPWKRGISEHVVYADPNYRESDDGLTAGSDTREPAEPTVKDSLSVQTGPAEPVREWQLVPVNPLHYAGLVASEERADYHMKEWPGTWKKQWRYAAGPWQDAATSAAEGTK